MKGINMHELSESLKKARRWLVESNNRFCKQYGLRVDHLTLNRIESSERIIEDNELIGHTITIIRHPCQIPVKQIWILWRNGKMKLDYEEPMKRIDGFKYQGRLITAEELWG